VLEVAFSDGAFFRIPFELMRVYSPSAEVQGHGPGQEVLQTGKRDVTLVNLEPVGNYAVSRLFRMGTTAASFLGLPLRAGSQQDALWATTPSAWPQRAWTATHPMAAKGGRPAAATDGWAACWMTICTIGCY
jgi:DUF971 family protein